MNEVHKVLRRFGIRTRRSFRLTIRAFAIIIGLFTVFFVNVNLGIGDFDTALHLYFIVVVIAILELVLADVLADQSFPFDTERKLALMENRLGADIIQTISNRLSETIKDFRGCDRSSISGTVHIIAELNSTSDKRTREGLLQLTDYVGPEGGQKGRVTLINQGIIGRCARSERVESVDFASSEEYMDAMIREFGFTKRETSRHTASARSYLAYPLVSANTLIGVLYFFTTEPQVFPRAASDAHLERLANELVNYLKIVQLA